MTTEHLLPLAAMKTKAEKVSYYLRRAFDWIDAVPDGVAAALPAMPGIEREDAESALAALDAALAATPKEPSQIPCVRKPGEVVAWMWQHKETGNVGFVDAWQIDNGWERANPRLRLIRSLVFAALAPSSEAAPAPAFTLEQIKDAIHHEQWDPGMSADYRKGYFEALKDAENGVAKLYAEAAPAPVVPAAVLQAVERMSQPLHESRLSGVTAQEDARCMKLIADFIRALAAPSADRAAAPSQAPTDLHAAIPAQSDAEFVRMLLWDDFPECCGCPVADTGGEYMGQTETVMSCCGNPEPAKLADAQIVASLRERFPEHAAAELVAAAASQPKEQQ